MKVTIRNLFLLIAFSANSAAFAEQACKGKTTLAINNTEANTEIVVELAIKERKRRQGLMFRAELGQRCGMLFVFDNYRRRTFTMQNTLIPLDIAFIDTDGKIVEIFSMEPGGQYYPSSVEAQYALEMNKGWFANNDVAVDDMIVISAENEQPLTTLLKN